MKSKSPSPNKDGVGDVDVEVSTGVPSDSSDVVVSGGVLADLNSISESESESCGKVLLCVSERFGFLVCQTTKAWVGCYILHLHHCNIKGIAAEHPLNYQVLHS